MGVTSRRSLAGVPVVRMRREVTVDEVVEERHLVRAEGVRDHHVAVRLEKRQRLARRHELSSGDTVSRRWVYSSLESQRPQHGGHGETEGHGGRKSQSPFIAKA